MCFLQEGKVYYVTGDYLKAKDPVYNNLSNELEMRLTNTTTVERLVDGDDAIPHTKYEFQQIGEVKDMAVKDELGELLLIECSEIFIF